MNKMLFALAFLSLFQAAPAFADDDARFGTHLQKAFHAKACTKCHDFFEKDRGGLSFNSHMGRGADMCVLCHSKDVTGFEHEDEWFAMPGLYTSGMDARQTCEAVKAALHAKFKNPSLLARQLTKHLLEDPRVLWGIEGATPNSGKLPEGRREVDLVKGGLKEWREHVLAWIDGGMKCR